MELETVMIGYHYTSWENWLKIKKEGLIPYNLRDDITDMLLYKEKGIFIFDRMQGRRGHAGSLMFQLSLRNSVKIVLLKVKYDKKDTLTVVGDSVAGTHKGEVGSFLYHEAAPFKVLFSSISPDNVELVGKYDLVKLLNGGQK